MYFLQIFEQTEIPRKKMVKDTLSAFRQKLSGSCQASERGEKE
jgi:hypothetical protein